MSQEKLKVIERPIVSVGGELNLSEPVMDEVQESEGVADLDLSGFVPASEDLDLSDLIPVEMETGKLFLTPMQRMLKAISGLSFHSIEMTQRVGEATDALDAINGPDWFRPPVPAERLRSAIERYKRELDGLNDPRYAKRLLERAEDLWKSTDETKWEDAKVMRLKAQMAPFEAARLASEAARLEAAISAGRPVPGGLLDIQLGGRAAYLIPDIHGNEWGWWKIWNTPLDDGRTLKQKFEDGDHVASLGDATHPDFRPVDHWAPSENILNDIFGLARDSKHPLWYTPGNHDPIYGAGENIPIKGDVLQGIRFRDHLIAKKGIAYVRSAQLFIDKSPFFIRLMHGDEVIAAAAHSSIVFGGMTPEDAAFAPYDPILRMELMWNRPVEHDNNTAYKPSDVVAMRSKIGSPHTIFVSGHTDQEIASFYKVDGMPGHIVGMATATYNDELAILEVTADSVEVININGKAALSGRNLRDEFISSREKKGLFKLFDFMPRRKSRAKAVGDPLKKPGGKGPANYKQDPVEVSRAMSGRKANGDKGKVSMKPMGFWMGTVKDTPLIINADGDTYEIFMNPAHGDAAEMLGAADEIIVEKRDPKAEKPMRMFLHDCMNFLGPLSIFKSGKGLWLEIMAQRSSGIASRAALYLRRTEKGMARLTIHDPAGFEMRPTEVPRPTRTSTSTAMPPPPPNGKPNGNGPCKFKQDASDFVGIARAMPAAETPESVLDTEYPIEMSALACAGILESSMPGIDAVTYSAMLAVPYLKV